MTLVVSFPALAEYVALPSDCGVGMCPTCQDIHLYGYNEAGEVCANISMSDEVWDNIFTQVYQLRANRDKASGKKPDA